MDRKSLQAALSDPRKIILRLHWQYHRHLQRKQGIQVMEQDWDNLIVLDACRFDLFEAHNTIDGDLSKVISGGSHTVEFLQTNFSDKTHLDTVYVTATPQFRRTGAHDYVFKTIDVWRDRWNDDFETVTPDAMADAVREAHSEFPEKRIVGHFVQPHYPFIGETGREISEAVSAKSGLEGKKVDDMSIWDHLQAGNVEETKIRRAYRENLKIVLEHVQSLIDDLDGKTVVTSDHGNVFGQWGMYGHPPKKFLRKLVYVPWLEVPHSNRRKITRDDRIAEDSVDTNVVEERLGHLGYK